MTSPSLTHLLAEYVDADFGASDLTAVRRILGDAGDDAFPTAQVMVFLEALAKVQRRTLAQVYIWAGERLAPQITKLLPQVFKGHTSTRSILLQLSSLAPSAVGELLPDVSCPEFWQDFLDGATIRVGFDGPEEVGWLLEGMSRGLGTHFGERVDVSRPSVPAGLTERRLVDIKVMAERRAAVRPTGGASGLSAANSRG